ncbi:hypothetical protein [Pedobacter panaciterrae]
MADLAPGPISGFLFQFEKALSLLASLSNPTDSVSIEMVDDVAMHNENDVVIMTVQAKHSISPNGSTFEDTSKALWRTLEIWIQKLQSGELNQVTQFVCCTNKIIAQGSLLRNIKDKTFSEVIKEVTSLLSDQKDKLKIAQSKKDTAGATIKETIKRIEYVLSNSAQFEIIKNNIVIDDELDPKERFFISVHMSNKKYNDERRFQTFQSMYGWIVDTSKAKWKNSDSATFSKEDFETRFALCFNNPSIVNAVFRKKDSLGPINTTLIQNTRNELFVKQIDDIKRNKDAKQRKIENAILDFIYHDIEMAHLSKEGELTQTDFDEFKKIAAKNGKHIMMLWY